MRRRIEETTRAFVRGLTGAPSKRPPSPLPEQLASLLVFGRPTSFLRRPMMRCMAVGPVLLPTTRTRLVPFVPRAARYGFGEVRVARLALLIFTAMSGSHSCGVVITKFSDHVVTFRSSPTVFADTPVPTSASTCILAGKLGRTMSSAAMLLHLYRGIGSSLIARLLNSQPLKALLSRDMRRSEGTGRSKGSQTTSSMKCRTLWGGVSVALIL